MKKLFVFLFVVFFISACGSAEPPVIPAVELTVEPTVVPIEVVIPELPETVGERGKLSLSLTEVEVVQGKCTSDIVELTASVEDLRWNFIPQDPSNPLVGVSPCIGDTQYGAGSDSGKFGLYAPTSLEPGTYQIEIKVFIWIDQHSGEYLSLPLTVVVIEKE